MAENPQGRQGEVEMRLEDPAIICGKCGRETPRNGDVDPFATPPVKPKAAGPDWVAPVTLLRRSYMGCPWCAKAAMPNALKKSRRARCGEKVEGQMDMSEFGSIRV